MCITLRSRLKLYGDAKNRRSLRTRSERELFLSSYIIYIYIYIGMRTK